MSYIYFIMYRYTSDILFLIDNIFINKYLKSMKIIWNNIVEYE